MQEEEAALLSIGAVLEWELLPPDLASRCEEIPPCFTSGIAVVGAYLGSYEDYWEYNLEFNPDGSSDAKAVAIHFEKDKRPGHQRTARNVTFMTQQHWYNSIAEAKAACEIHAATGQFPLCVELEISGSKGLD